MKSLLIDTNILLLLIVGTWDRPSIQRHRRTAIFSPEDYDLLASQLPRYQRLVTTHGILAEASNLVGESFHEAIAPTIIAVCTPLVEMVRPKEELFAQDGFARLGFADASALAALDAQTVLLTDDVDLYNQALYLGNDAINFSHLRRFEG